MRNAFAIGLTLLLAAPGLVCGNDETLRFYLSKSDLVVVGEIASDPTRASEEVGVVIYTCDFRITATVSGRKPIEDSIAINIIRLERDDADRVGELKKGFQCILFLKNVGSDKTPRWETADVWFGLQRATPTLERSLQRIVSENWAQGQKFEATHSWSGLLREKTRAELAPRKGYLTSSADWKKLWETWRPDEKLPEVDFTTHLVLVDLCGMYPAWHELRVTDQGDLRIRLNPRVPPWLGYGYAISVIERGAVKTIQGKAINPELD